MKFLFRFWLAALLLLAPAAFAQQLLNGVAVIVNDSIITYEDIKDEVLPLLEVLERQYRGQPQQLEQKISELERERIEELVARKLILHEYKSKGYAPPESIFDEELKKHIQKYYGDRLTLTKTLQARGVTFETFRQERKEDLIVMMMREKHVPQQPLISPYKIEKYYQENQDKFRLQDQVKLRMIFLDKTRHGENTRKLAEEILGKLADGASFAEMASIYSDGAQRSQGGEYGWVEKSFLREDLARVAFGLKKGERSGVIEGEKDCYLLLVEDSRLAHVRPLTEVQEEIDKILKAEEMERLHKKWIETLKEKSFIRYF